MITPETFISRIDDATVRRQLRDLDEPMCYFGESNKDRRERLTKALAKLSPEERLRIQANSERQLKALDDNNKITYLEGPQALRDTRYAIANYSLRQCNERLDMARLTQQMEPLPSRLIRQQELIEKVRNIEDMGFYQDEDETVNELKSFTACQLNPSATLMATSSRSGKCKLWTIPDMETNLHFRSSQVNANFITFSPKSGSVELSPSAANLTSCYIDGSITMWNLIEETPVCRLSGPQNWRVTRVRYHPSGKYLASCCSDNSWRLWDIASETELLKQAGGHSEGIFDLAFHPDGSLAATASLDSYGRVWDLRTGKSIQTLDGHTKGLRTIDIAPNGYHIATGSMDNSVKIWNLRQRKLEYTIPAHLNTITTVMFEKENGYYLATSSFDKTVKFWSSKTWAPVKTLDAFDEKVINMDISSSSEHLVSCYFKYVKLWTVFLNDL